MAVRLDHPDKFANRHIGPESEEIAEMLRALGVASLDELIDQTVPRSIRLGRALDLPPARTEQQALDDLGKLAAQNKVYRSYLGMGYADTFTPPVILRNILMNPGWYTAYTPYQAEIAQGRLEALLNYQQMIIDLTGLEVANASLLDEATAAAESMHMAWSMKGDDHKNAIFVASTCHPQTIDLVRTRAEPIGVEVIVADPAGFDPAGKKLFGAIVQYPDTYGEIREWRGFAEKVHAEDAVVVAACDLLALALITPPGEWGADIAIGSSQRFGVPLGYGGPHAAFMATKLESVRKMPGRLIGVSKDAHGKTALRMALATREQHIRREKATSNICTAQVLLAVCAGMYAVYHGPRGIRAIAERVHGWTTVVARALGKAGIKVRTESWFDTIRVEGAADKVRAWHAAADQKQINLRRIDDTSVGIALDETTGAAEVRELLALFGVQAGEAAETVETSLPEHARRKSAYLTHPVFNTHHSETEMLRYLKKLENRDLSLTHSMIPLGSCTMKLNATAEMIPITWPGIGRIHPFAPTEQTKGYQQLFRDLERWLGEITGFAGVSLQPNAGSQGEYAGLLVIRAYHKARGQGHRDVCLIPSSAHGTNPASAAMCGMKVVVVATDEKGNVDLADLARKAKEHADELSALMVTYPSTHGVFEEDIKKICAVVHEHGGQVYMDGANMNAQVGLCRPGDMGADVCHLNLHKTFCIPHGGGGPGMGPIGVAAHLVPFLPGHPVVRVGGEQAVGAVSAGPWGSASILPISYQYIAMMGGEGLTLATKIAILNANYIAHRLAPHYPVLYTGQNDRVAHECIIDPRGLKAATGVEVEDIAKRLMDYGFHAPTVSFPVAGTLMIEPTESESKAELDRFCDSMIAIREEIREVEQGTLPRDDNPLKHAPHTMEAVIADAWTHAYSRERAAFPAPFTRERKFWPHVGRVESAYGDRNLVCSCVPTDAYAEVVAG